MRKAFTLVELIASAVLAAMMMVGLMSVVWSASRDLRDLRSEESSGFPTTLLIDRIRTDFVNARGMQVSSEGIALHGFVGRDPRTREPLWTPARVVYRTVETDSGRVLVRQQADSPAEAIWVGVQGLAVEALEQVDPDDISMPMPATGGLPEVPGALRITLVGDRGQTLWREVIRHHD